METKENVSTKESVIEERKTWDPGNKKKYARHSQGNSARDLRKTTGSWSRKQSFQIVTVKHGVPEGKSPKKRYNFVNNNKCFILYNKLILIRLKLKMFYVSDRELRKRLII